MPFQIALSGLNAASTSLSTTANNIANVNTTGFKGSRANFVELFATGLQNVAENATGLGARPSSIQQLFSQGSLEFSDNNLDLAMVGEGFFTLSDDQGALSYTRAGNFSVNRDGIVVNDQGLKLQSFPPLPGVDGFNTGQLQDLRLETTDADPAATRLMELSLNLPSDVSAPEEPWIGPAVDPVTGEFNPPLPETFNHTTSVTIFDSLGTEKTATYYFVKVDSDPGDPGATPPVPEVPENRWQVYLTVDGELVEEDPVELQFSTDGRLEDVSPFDPDNPSTSFDFFDPGDPDADPVEPPTGFPSPPAADLFLSADFANLTQFGSSFNVNNLSQDGFSSGRLAAIEINSEGVVFARFTNGQSNELGQLALTNFRNPEGLENVSDTRWAETFESGQALRGPAGSGNFGTVQAGALESANVDLAKELVDMITAQRTFQANAQMISTADQVTQTIINIR